MYWLHTQLVKSIQNAYIEEVNRIVRHEWLELELFASIERVSYLRYHGLELTIMTLLIWLVAF